MIRRFAPRLLRLEERCQPATFGNAWLDGTHLTLSLAPNGAAITGAANSLTTLLDSLGPNSRLEVLRAFQNWVVNANINIGLVGDGGQDFFSLGAIQGDSRFGDIRVGARPLADDVLSIATPFNLFSTDAGNVVLNVNGNLSVGGAGSTRDLYTIVLQEAGHALGIANSPDTSSVMYEWYIGPRTGLSTADVAAVQALYNARQADAFEGANGNATLPTAPTIHSGIEADLTTASDVDCYRYEVKQSYQGNSFRVQAAGLSLVAARLEVLNSGGQVIASTSTTDPLNNNLAIDLPPAPNGTTYYVRVSSARSDVFGVGAYRLAAGSTPQVSNWLSPTALISEEAGLNDTIASATVLTQTVSAVDNRIDYATRRSLSSASDVDCFRVHAPANDGSLIKLAVGVWGLNGFQFQPQVTVYDAGGNPLAAQLLTSDGGSFVVQANNVAAGADYYVRIASASGAVGNYSLATDFRTTSLVAFDMGSAGTLTQNSATTTAALTVGQSEQLHFVLSGVTGTPSADGALQFTIRDAQGNVVFTLLADDGSAASGNVFLAAGQYTVEVRAYSKSGGILAPLTYRLDASVLTDPVGVSEAGSNEDPGGGSSGGGGGSSGGGTSWVILTGSGTTWF